MSEMQLKGIGALTDGLTRVPGVRADCFFVTAAILLRTTVDEISRRTGIPVPAPGTSGISAADVIQGLTRLGLVFNVWTYQEEGRGDAGGPIHPPHRVGISEALAGSAVGMPRVVGAAYIRPNGIGHVVICRNPGRPYRRYQDYQISHDGADVTGDVRASRIFAYFAVDTTNSRGEFIDQQGQAIEQMEVDEEQAHPDDEEPMDYEIVGPSDEGNKGGHRHDEL